MVEQGGSSGDEDALQDGEHASQVALTVLILAQSLRWFWLAKFYKHTTTRPHLRALIPILIHLFPTPRYRLTSRIRMSR